MIPGFCHEGDENCALLGYYKVSSGNFFYRHCRTNYWCHLHLRFTILHEIIFQQFPMFLLVQNGKKSSKAALEQNHAPCNNKWGTKVQFHTFITLTLGGLSPSFPSHFTPTNNWKEGWVSPRASSDMVANRKIHSPDGKQILVLQV